MSFFFFIRKVSKVWTTHLTGKVGYISNPPWRDPNSAHHERSRKSLAFSINTKCASFTKGPIHKTSSRFPKSVILFLNMVVPPWLSLASGKSRPFPLLTPMGTWAPSSSVHWIFTTLRKIKKSIMSSAPLRWWEDEIIIWTCCLFSF